MNRAAAGELSIVEAARPGAAGQTVLLVPGAMHSAACYLSTPDGRPG